jgi:hypothetical protein
MENADYYRQKAAQCRRLADALINQDDPVVAAMLALAMEFETKAVALAAEVLAVKQVDQLSTDELPEDHGAFAGSA